MVTRIFIISVHIVTYLKFYFALVDKFQNYTSEKSEKVQIFYRKQFALLTESRFLTIGAKEELTMA